MKLLNLQGPVHQNVQQPEPPAQGKKQLSEAQKASLPIAPEIARQAKLAKSEAKREEVHCMATATRAVTAEDREIG